MPYLTSSYSNAAGWRTQEDVMNSFVVCLVLFGFAQAAPTPLQPVPEVAAPKSTELFKCVKYRGLRNIAPCAVPAVVQVPDPCRCVSLCKCVTNCKCDCACKCTCDVKTVSVQICVPKSCCDVKPCVTQRGNRTRFDYGKYAVNVISINGRLVVDYDD